MTFEKVVVLQGIFHQIFVPFNAFIFTQLKIPVIRLKHKLLQ